MRFLRLFVVLAGVSLLGSPATGQVFEWYPYDAKDGNSLTEVEFGKWINMSRCLCDAYQGSSSQSTFWVRVHEASGALTNDEIYFYLGDECDSDTTTISEVCRELEVINLSDFNEDQWLAIPAHWIVDPLDGECSEVNGGTTTIYAIKGDPNASTDQEFTITFDTRPAGTPINVSARGGENAVTVAWDPPEDDDENIEYYNVLCSLAGAPLESPHVTADWVTTQEVCGQDLTVDDIPDPDAGTPDAGVDAGVDAGLDATVTTDGSVVDAQPQQDASTVQSDAAVQNDAATQADGGTSTTNCDSITSGLTAGARPNPCFVCGTLQATSSNTSLRITGLENDLVYDFAVVSVDDNGNVSPVSEVVSATPVITIDFAEHYHDSGGVEEGGFCYVATATYGSYDHPSVQTLRGYRDRVLARSPAGRRFIAWYYENGPALATAKQQSPVLSVLSRLGVDGLVWMSRQLTPGSRSEGSGAATAAIPLGLLLLGLMLGLRRLSGTTEEEDGEPDDDESPGREVTP